jgi:hypothetical protein
MPVPGTTSAGDSSAEQCIGEQFGNAGLGAAIHLSLRSDSTLVADFALPSAHVRTSYATRHNKAAALSEETAATAQ